MALIRPFRGYRPRGKITAQVACPPYDVLSSDEARQVAKNNPRSFLHVIKPEIDLEPEVDPYAEAVYAKGAENLQKLIADGDLVPDAAPAVYLYQQQMGAHHQTGLVCCVSADEYDQGLIKKHELTREEKELDRTRHVDVTNANTGPVFLTYRARPNTDALIERLARGRASVTFTAGSAASPVEVRHTLWVIDDAEEIAQVVRAFASVPYLSVGEGPHRPASAARVARQRREANADHTGEEEYNFFMAVLFAHDQLQILPYNRVILDLGDLTPESFLERLGDRFHVEPTESPAPQAPRHFGLHLGGSWYALAVKEETMHTGKIDDAVSALDVTLLQELVLSPLLGIDDPRRDQRIDFVGGIRGIAELERRCAEDAAGAFALYPTTVDQLLDVADAGQIMPPKSTWFEPKLRSGLVVHFLGD